MGCCCVGTSGLPSCATCSPCCNGFCYGCSGGCGACGAYFAWPWCCSIYSGCC
ncbi:Protein of unknown function [Gryllus bimaculatus]|nr:Protein of unknown function [Gryllus bimaculatus]